MLYMVRKDKDPTSHVFFEAPLSKALEPECRIILSMWSSGPLIVCL